MSSSSPAKVHTYRSFPDGASCSFLCRRIHSKAAASPRLSKEILDFDTDLALQLEDLKPKDGAKILKLSWLSRAITVALKKHLEAVELIPRLDFPLSVHDEKWMNEYMDQTARFLDVCNAFTCALSNVEQGQLLIRHACHVLLDADNASLEEKAQSSDIPVVISEAALARSHKSLQEWVNLQVVIEQGSPRYSQLLKDMVKDLRPPQDRDLNKGKGFLHALYGANATAVFAFYVLSLAILREGHLLSLTLPISLAVPWSASMSYLVQIAKDEAAVKSSFNVYVEDLNALHYTVRDLIAIIERLCEVKSCSVPEGERKALAGAVCDLCSQMNENAKGLNMLSTALNSMMKAIVSSRSSLLDKSGDFGPDNL